MHGIGGARSEGTEGIELTAMSHQDLDITDSREVNDVISHLCPDVIINTAAYTHADGAETALLRSGFLRVREEWNESDR